MFIIFQASDWLSKLNFHRLQIFTVVQCYILIHYDYYYNCLIRYKQSVTDLFEKCHNFCHIRYFIYFFLISLLLRYNNNT